MDPALAHESRAAIPVAVVIATLSVAVITVALRTYTRLVVIKQFGYDDVGAVISLLMAVGCGVSIACGSLYGAGRHLTVVNPSLIPLYFRSFYVSIVLYNAALTSVKFTFLLQYYRIFEVRKMQKAILIAGIFIGCWTISQLLITIFTCHPISKFWNSSLPGSCIPSLPFWYINAAGNILTDVTIFVLPLPALRSLNLHRNQKIVLLAIFSLGFFTCAISLIRIQYLRLSTDTTWDNVGASCWSITEPCSAILCVCLPVLRPLASNVLGGRLWSSRGDDTKTYHQHSAGRDGSAPHSHYHSRRTRGGGGGGGGVGLGSDHRTPSETSSQQRVFVRGKSDALLVRTQDLELQRVDDSDDDSLECGAAAEVAVVSRPERSLFSERNHADGGRSRKLGLRAGVTTEIMATTPRSPDGPAPPAGGITVHRNVVVDGG
ncbi:Integral membrane protein [Coniochaeta hoffmannii]|uniref:Integral membrane protein n=1 Tax=Coniochaeta hoffmannii TaxID=91930 RepID=A0AA38SF40_9PEZI|nr:Integral membrane protein [Coniochaeta hoffmannii]